MVFIFLLFTSACKTGREQTDEHYIKNPKHKLHQMQEVGGFTLTLQYIPAGIKLRQLQERGVQLVKADSMGVYAFDDFRFEISKPLWKPDKQVMEYLQFGIANDLVLVMGPGDTLRSSICERIANGSSSTHIYLASFAKRTSEVKDIQFVYTDKLLQTGSVTFTIPAAEILRTSEKLSLK